MLKKRPLRAVFARSESRLLVPMSQNSFNGDKLSRSHNTSAVVAVAAMSVKKSTAERTKRTIVVVYVTYRTRTVESTVGRYGITLSSLRGRATLSQRTWIFVASPWRPTDWSTTTKNCALLLFLCPHPAVEIFPLSGLALAQTCSAYTSRPIAPRRLCTLYTTTTTTTLYSWRSAILHTTSHLHYTHNLHVECSWCTGHTISLLCFNRCSHLAKGHAPYSLL